jgi:hypothetical protein
MLNRLLRILGFKKKLRTDSEWCLVGNVRAQTRHGRDGSDIQTGTKHFSPGTKVYCLPPLWHDGYEKIKVVGRHRGTRKLVTMVVKSDWITNWRAKVVYSPEVRRHLSQAARHRWQSQKDVEKFAKLILKWQAEHDTDTPPETDNSDHPHDPTAAAQRLPPIAPVNKNGPSEPTSEN